MVWHNVAFLLLLLLSCTYAFVGGGAPERLVAAIMLAATGLTVFASAPWIATFRSLEFRLFLVDFVALLMFLAISQNANRAWPMLVTAFQFAAIGIHFAEALNSNQKPLGYALLEALPAWAHIPILAMGTWRHRNRLKIFGCDYAWSKRKSANFVT